MRAEQVCRNQIYMATIGLLGHSASCLASRFDSRHSCHIPAIPAAKIIRLCRMR
jgi:hypothetical protein